MQELIKTIFEEQKNRLIDKRDAEWVNFTGESGKRSLMTGTPNISTFLTIGDNYVTRLLDAVLDNKEMLLSSDTAPVDDERLFVELTGDLITLMQTEYKYIRDRAFMRFELMSREARTALSRDIDLLISQRTSSIRQRVTAIKARLNARLPETTCAPALAPSGPAVLGCEALYVSIQTKIQKAMESENIRFLETLQRILDEINKHPIDKKSKLFLMQNLEFLIDQYNAPVDKKIPGLINASLYYLASAADDADIWLQFGPVIVAYFNKFM
jgi:hypothetical protein